MSQSQQRNRPTKAPMRGRRPPMGSGTPNQQQQQNYNQQQQQQRSRGNRSNRGRGGGTNNRNTMQNYQQYQNNQSNQNQAPDIPNQQMQSNVNMSMESSQPKKTRSRPPVKAQNTAIMAQFNQPPPQVQQVQIQQQQQQQQQQAAPPQVQVQQPQQAQQVQQVQQQVQQEVVVTEAEIKEDIKAEELMNTKEERETIIKKNPIKPTTTIKRQPPWLEFTGQKPPIKCGWAHRVREVLSADTLRIALLKPRQMDQLNPPEIIQITLDGIQAPRCQRWDSNMSDNRDKRDDKKKGHKKGYKQKKDEKKDDKDKDKKEDDKNKDKDSKDKDEDGPKPATSTWQPLSEDEPYAYEAREFVRDKILNKNIFYAIWRSNDMRNERDPSKIRYWGDIYYQENKYTTRSLTNELISNGYAKLKENKYTDLSEDEKNRLSKKQKEAKKNSLNIWSLRDNGGNSEGRKHIRKIQWISYQNQTSFGEKYKNKPLHGIVNKVISGSTIRVELVVNKNQNEFKNVVVNIAGVNCPKIPQTQDSPNYKGKRNRNKYNKNKNKKYNKNSKQEQELSLYFGIKAREWTEERLLGQIVDVKILFVSNKQIIAQIIHSKGRIGPSLLKKGLAQYEGWTAKQCDLEEQKLLFTAYSMARKQEPALNIWQFIKKEDLKNEQMVRIVKIISGDTVEVQKKVNELDTGYNGIIERYTLSSIRAPRLGTRGGYGDNGSGKYEAKYAQPDEYLARDAKELVRQKCIGKEVRLIYEYCRQTEFTDRKSKNLKKTKIDKKFASIYIKNEKKNGREENIAIELIKRGLAELVWHSKNESDRSEDYALLESEFNKARDKKIGLNAYLTFDRERQILKADDKKRKQQAKLTEISDYSGIDPSSNIHISKIVELNQFLLHNRVKGIIEFIFGANRVKVYIPSRKVCIAVRLADIRCGDFTLDDRNKGNKDPHREAAKEYLNGIILQRDIELQITSTGMQQSNRSSYGRNRRGRGGRKQVSGAQSRNPNLDGHIYYRCDGSSNKFKNISEDLLERGWAQLIRRRYSDRDSSNRLNKQTVPHTFSKCEQYAKDNKLGIWKNAFEEKEQDDAVNEQRQKQSMTGKEMDVIVSYVESATVFWINEINNNDKMKLMSEEMEKLKKITKTPAKIRKGGGVKYAAKYDGHYARARVSKRDPREKDNQNNNNNQNNNDINKESNWFVMFIDYGNKASISRKNFTELPAHLRLDKIPELARKCQLAGITIDKKYNAKEYNDAGWFFNSLAFQSENQKLKMKILYDDLYKKTWYVELFVGPSSQNQSINHRIAREGYVTFDKDLPQAIRNGKEYGKNWEKPHKEYCERYLETIKANIKLAQSEHRNIWKHGNIEDDNEDDNFPDNSQMQQIKKGQRRGR